MDLRIWSVTADDLFTNVSTFEKLGCKLSGVSVEEMQNYFIHPAKNLPVYVIFDACHMLKLARNVLCDKNLSSDSEIISWGYLRKLHEIQNEFGFKFANRLSGVHINYRNKIRNVLSIAAQTISLSTADAIEFLMECKQSIQNFQVLGQQ